MFWGFSMKTVWFAETGDALRPMTCTTPKLLLPVVGRPLLSYILDTLYQNGTTDVYILLPFADRRVTDFVQYRAPKNMSVRLLNADADSCRAVLQALEQETEPICFLYGTCFFEFDLQAAAQWHSETDADITVLCTRSNGLREGTALLTDADAKLTGGLPFFQNTKPMTDRADSGVYMLRPAWLPQVLESAAKAEENSVLPYLPPCAAFVYAAHGCLNPVDTPAAYRTLARDILHGETQVSPPYLADGIYAAAALPKGNYQLIPPVCICANVTVADGAQIGPNTVLGENCYVGQNAVVANSILREGAAVYREAKVSGTVVCENAVVKEGAVASENCVIGADAVVGRHALLGQGVRIWQRQAVENGMRVSGNVQYPLPRQTLFTENGMLYTAGETLDPILLAAFGRALSGCTFGKKVGVLYDGSHAAAAAVRIVSGALSAQGSGVWCFGKGFLPQLHFYTAFCDLQAGIFLSAYKGQLRLQIFAAGGLLLSGAQTASLTARLQIGDYPAAVPEGSRAVSDMHDMQTMYLRELSREAGVLLEQQSVRIQCPNAQISMLLEDALYRLQAKTGDEVTLRISGDGTRVSAFHRECGYLPHERLLAICCNASFAHGQDVALSADAPFALDRIAAKNGRHVLHYPCTLSEEPDAQTRTLAREQLYVRDGLFMSMRLLGILQQSGKSLAQLNSALPPFFVRRKSVPLCIPTETLLQTLHLHDAELQKEGIVWQTARGRVLLTPQHAGRQLRILAEAASFETAKALCEEAEERLINH